MKSLKTLFVAVVWGFVVCAVSSCVREKKLNAALEQDKERLGHEWMASALLEKFNECGAKYGYFFPPSQMLCLNARTPSRLLRNFSKCQDSAWDMMYVCRAYDGKLFSYDLEDISFTEPQRSGLANGRCTMSFKAVLKSSARQDFGNSGKQWLAGISLGHCFLSAEGILNWDKHILMNHSAIENTEEKLKDALSRVPENLDFFFMLEHPSDILLEEKEVTVSLTYQNGKWSSEFSKADIESPNPLSDLALAEKSEYDAALRGTGFVPHASGRDFCYFDSESENVAAELEKGNLYRHGRWWSKLQYLSYLRGQIEKSLLKVRGMLVGRPAGECSGKVAMQDAGQILAQDTSGELIRKLNQKRVEEILKNLEVFFLECRNAFLNGDDGIKGVRIQEDSPNEFREILRDMKPQIENTIADSVEILCEKNMKPDMDVPDFNPNGQIAITPKMIADYAQATFLAANPYFLELPLGTGYKFTCTSLEEFEKINWQERACIRYPFHEEGDFVENIVYMKKGYSGKVRHLVNNDAMIQIGTKLMELSKMTREQRSLFVAEDNAAMRKEFIARNREMVLNKIEVYRQEAERLAQRHPSVFIMLSLYEQGYVFHEEKKAEEMPEEDGEEEAGISAEETEKAKMASLVYQSPRQMILSEIQRRLKDNLVP